MFPTVYFKEKFLYSIEVLCKATQINNLKVCHSIMGGYKVKKALHALDTDISV